jgi:hypothetical protein
MYNQNLFKKILTIFGNNEKILLKENISGNFVLTFKIVWVFKAIIKK